MARHICRDTRMADQAPSHPPRTGATCTGDSYAWRSTPCRSEGALCLRRTPPDCVKVGSGSPETGPPNTRKRNASPGDAATPCTDTYVHPTKRICASPGPPSALASNSRLLHRPRGPRRNLLFTPQIPPTFLNQVLTKGQWSPSCEVGAAGR